MKQWDRKCLQTAAAVFIAILILARIGAAQEGTQTPREAVEEIETKKTPPTSFTIYPVPNYSGDFWSRSYLSGDWGGLSQSWPNMACNSNLT